MCVTSGLAATHSKLRSRLSVWSRHSHSRSLSAWMGVGGGGCLVLPAAMEGVLIDPKDESLYAAHHDLMGLQLRYIFHTKTGRLRLVEVRG